MLHFLYVIAIKDSGIYGKFSSIQIYTLGFFNLKIVWLKLLIIWRFFRLWGLAAGIDSIENMTRCMSNNYSGIDFWRHWHCSYNRWLVRYIYIPLGGSNVRILNSFAIFTFVALWHDTRGDLFMWGWLIVLFILPELICVRLFCNSKVILFFLK
jgi:D-alanyl-lipoteichoic acid acyltransferase DltB (MBOAT superfamily)